MKPGLKGLQVGAWHGIYAPKGTPDDVVQKLAKALQDSLRDPDLMKRFNDINTVRRAAGSGHAPGAEGESSTSEVDRWAPIIKATGQVRGLRAGEERPRSLKRRAPAAANGNRKNFDKALGPAACSCLDL